VHVLVFINYLIRQGIAYTTVRINILARKCRTENKMYTFPAALLESMLLCKYILKNYCMTLFFKNNQITY